MIRRWLVAMALLWALAACRERPPGAPAATPDLSMPTLAVAEIPAGNNPTNGPPVPVTPGPHVTDTGGHLLGTGPDDTPATVTPSPTPCVPTHDAWPRYQVQQGDTLFEIATATGSSVAELSRVNCLERPEALAVGQDLRVPRLPDPTPVPTPARVTLERFEIYPRPLSVDGELTLSWKVRGATLVYLWAGGWSSGPVPGEGRVNRPVADLVDEFAGIRVGIRAVDEAELGDEVVAEEFVPIATGVTIQELRLTPDPVPSNGSVRVSWSFTGADAGTLYWMPRPYNGILEPYADDIPPSGSLDVQLLDEYAPIQFRVEAIDENGLRVTRDATLAVSCPYDYFVSDPARQDGTCPTSAPISVTGAFQPFEGGFMTWESDNERILVFLDDGSVRWFDDNWDGEPIDVGEDPPPGLYQPERGFGLAWASDDALRARLGWATAPERSYELRKQQIYQKGTRYGVNSGAWYLELPEGRVVVFHVDYAHEQRWWWVGPSP